MKYVAMKSVSTVSTMKCRAAQGLLSPYLDGAVTGTEMLALQ